MADLAPLAGLTGLQRLWLDGTQVADLAPLAGLTALQRLSLGGTQVADLGPLAGLTGLIDAAIKEADGGRHFPSGLTFARTPVARRAPFKNLVSRKQPALTIETINYVRREAGLPEHRPNVAKLEEDAPPDTPREIPPIPPTQPAAIEPAWRDGRLTLPGAPLQGSLQKPDLDAALLALKQLISELVDEANEARNTGNAVDHRGIKFLSRLADKIPTGTPRQDQLFVIAHALERLREYKTTVESEWPSVVAAGYHAMVLAYERTVRQFPKWKEFALHAQAYTFTGEQADATPHLAHVVASELRNEVGKEFADEELPQAIDALANEADNHAGEATAASPTIIPVQLAADLLESLSNTLKRIAEYALASVRSAWKAIEPERKAAADFVREARERFRTELVQDGPKAGSAAYKWFKRAAKTSIASLGAFLGGVQTGLFDVLMTKFPEYFSWLVDVLKYLI